MARKKVRVNLKRIGKPLDSINARLTKVIKRGDDADYAQKVARQLKGIRKQLAEICENNRWFIDV